MPVKLVKPRRFGDARGWFIETYHRDRYAALGIHADFVQDNHSFSQAKGTLRGLHWQAPPHGQAKLVRCVAGAIWNDPALALPWPLDGAAPTLSDKDTGLPRLNEAESPFAYDGQPLEPIA